MPETETRACSELPRQKGYKKYTNLPQSAESENSSSIPFSGQISRAFVSSDDSYSTLNKQNPTTITLIVYSSFCTICVCRPWNLRRGITTNVTLYRVALAAVNFFQSSTRSHQIYLLLCRFSELTLDLLSWRCVPFCLSENSFCCGGHTGFRCGAAPHQERSLQRTGAARTPSGSCRPRRGNARYVSIYVDKSTHICATIFLGLCSFSEAAQCQFSLFNWA